MAGLAIAPRPARTAPRGRFTDRPVVVLVIPRGEAVRNLLYSETLPTLAQDADVVLLTVVWEQELLRRTAPYVRQVVPLREQPVAGFPAFVRLLAENAHDRWLWSAVAQNNWDLRDRRAREQGKRLQRVAIKAFARTFAREHALRVLTRLEQRTHYALRPTREFDELFGTLHPDLVFNGSHIHGQAGELPLRVAHAHGIPTAGFIFSWDNLTSRSRIVVPYDHYLVWHRGMKEQLCEIYPQVSPERVWITGTPQFDFHFRPEFLLHREELCRRVGIDPHRPFVLYTAGMAHHFRDEHRHVELVIEALAKLDLGPKPQLVVRTNIKDTSPEMTRLARSSPSFVAFPETQWDKEALAPHYSDLALYSSLLKWCTLGINVASTVSLELLMLDKPVINLDFDPPGASLPPFEDYGRHLRFDHYRRVAESGAVMVARSPQDVASMLARGLLDPMAGSEIRRRFIDSMFGGTLDGHSGRRVGEALFALAAGARKTGARAAAT